MQTPAGLNKPRLKKNEPTYIPFCLIRYRTTIRADAENGAAMAFVLLRARYGGR